MSELEFIQHCRDNNVELVKEGLTQKGLIVTAGDYFSLWIEDSRFEFAIMDTRIVKVIVENGYTEILEYLINVKDIDISFENNISFLIAVDDGHIDMVKLLLKNENVDPTIRDNSALIIAYDNCNKEMFKLLLNDDRVLKAVFNMRKDNFIRIKKELFNVLHLSPKELDAMYKLI